MTDIKQHSSYSQPWHAETLQELKPLATHEHLLLFPPNVSRFVHSSLPRGRAPMVQEGVSLHFSWPDLEMTKGLPI